MQLPFFDAPLIRTVPWYQGKGYFREQVSLGNILWTREPPSVVAILRSWSGHINPSMPAWQAKSPWTYLQCSGEQVWCFSSIVNEFCPNTRQGGQQRNPSVIKSARWTHRWDRGDNPKRRWNDCFGRASNPDNEVPNSDDFSTSIETKYIHESVNGPVTTRTPGSNH